MGRHKGTHFKKHQKRKQQRRILRNFWDKLHAFFNRTEMSDIDEISHLLKIARSGQKLKAAYALKKEFNLKCDCNITWEGQLRKQLSDKPLYDYDWLTIEEMESLICEKPSSGAPFPNEPNGIRRGEQLPVFRDR